MNLKSACLLSLCVGHIMFSFVYGYGIRICGQKPYNLRTHLCKNSEINNTTAKPTTFLKSTTSPPRKLHTTPSHVQPESLMELRGRHKLLGIRICGQKPYNLRTHLCKNSEIIISTAKPTTFLKSTTSPPRKLHTTPSHVQPESLMELRGRHKLLASGDFNSDFTIVTSTGAVSVATGKTLSASTTPCYSLVLNAVDNDATPLTGSTTVLVTVGSSTCSGGRYPCNGAAAVTAGIMTVIIGLFINFMK